MERSILLVLVLLSSCTSRNFDEFLSDKYRSGQLNGNVLIAQRGKIVYERSFGYADGSRKVKLDKDHKFQIGSIYKEFPAVAVLQLHEKGLLNVEDKVHKYRPDLPAWSEGITLLQLLRYTGGLPMVDWNKYFDQEKEITNEDLMNDLYALKTLEFSPGSDYLYTNYSPFILIKIVEEVSGLSFAEYCRNHIFTPFGLDGIVFQGRYPYPDKDSMAIPFDEDFKEDDYRVAVSGMFITASARGIFRWFQQLDEFQIVGEASHRLLSEKAFDREEVQAPLGTSTWRDDRLVEHTHHGSTGNFECVVRNFPQKDLIIVILTNQKHGNVYELSDEIYRRRGQLEE